MEKLTPLNSPKDLLFTDQALSQLLLMLKHDYTLEGLFFRIKIDGKGCEGFTYACGFSLPTEEDTLYTYGTSQFCFLMDPFTAHYFKRGQVDYYFEASTGEEGFLFKNHDEVLYHGKFFKDETLLPPH